MARFRGGAVLKKGQILFVCTGNIYRSAGAHLLAIHKYKIPGTGFDSAGTGRTCGGRPMARRMRDALLNHLRVYVDPKVFRSKRLTSELAQKSDYIVCMASAHVKYINVNLPGYRGEIVELWKYSSVPEYSNGLTDPAFTKGLPPVLKILIDIDSAIENWFLDRVVFADESPPRFF